MACATSEFTKFKRSDSTTPVCEVIEFAGNELPLLKPDDPDDAPVSFTFCEDR